MLLRLGSVAAPLVFLVIACGGAPTLEIGGGGNGENANAPMLSSGASTSQPKADACKATPVDAELPTINLVFVVDQSNSMGGEALAKKWTPVSTALKAFFNDPNSNGIVASLDYFPQTTTDDRTIKNCQPATYAKPDVLAAALPSGALVESVDAHTKEIGLHKGTPTFAALSGALDYAKTLSGKSAVVLVTDGAPASCSDNSITKVADRAAVDAATVPTFVVGVGPLLENLDTIAERGGTKAALQVSVDDPAKTKDELLAQFALIRSSVRACDIDIPAAPNGITFDLHKVNVVSTEGNTSSTLTYSASCEGGSGWRYDDVNAPKKVSLCEGSCGRMRSSGGAFSIEFGCGTLGGVK